MPEIVEEVDAEFDNWLASHPDDQATPGPASAGAGRRRPRLGGRSRNSDASPEPEAPPAAPSPLAEYEHQLKTAHVIRRSDSGRWLDLHLLTILAAAGALPALRVPAAWLLVCAMVGAVLVGVSSAHRQSATKGTADVVVLPARVAGRLALGCINPINWLKVLLGAIASLVAGALAGGLVAAARWLALDGPEGILAAARMGAWTHAARYGAVFACYLLLSGVGDTHERRAVALYRRAHRLREVALVGITALLVIASVTVTLAGPRSDLGFAHADDGLGWVPPGLRTIVDQGRDDLVRAELDGVTACLSGDAKGRWTSTYTAGNSLGDPDIATLTADPARAPDQAAIAAAALAAHNHLAPWVEAIRITIGGEVVLVVARKGLPTDAPVTDASTLRAHALGAPEWLTTAGPAVDSGAVLACSARTPF